MFFSNNSNPARRVPEVTCMDVTLSETNREVASMLIVVSQK